MHKISKFIKKKKRKKIRKGFENIFKLKLFLAQEESTEQVIIEPQQPSQTPAPSKKELEEVKTDTQEIKQDLYKLKQEIKKMKPEKILDSDLNDSIIQSM